MKGVPSLSLSLGDDPDVEEGIHRMAKVKLEGGFEAELFQIEGEPVEGPTLGATIAHVRFDGYREILALAPECLRPAEDSSPRLRTAREKP